MARKTENKILYPDIKCPIIPEMQPSYGYIANLI